MCSRRKVIYIIVMMLVLSSAGLAAGFARGKLHFPKHLDPTGTWLPVLSSSVSGAAFIQVRNRNIYRTLRRAPKNARQLKNSVEGSGSEEMAKGSFHVQSNPTC